MHSARGIRTLRAAVALLASVWLGVAADGAASLAVRPSVQSAAPETPLPNGRDSVKFAAIGDMGTGSREQYEVGAEMARRHDRFPYGFVLTLGDNLYGRQRPQDFVRKFEQPYRGLLDRGVTFHASLGNHDHPNNRFYPLWNMGGERYYTFTRGHVRFFALDTNALDRVQLAWLERELASATERWKVCFFHHPLYSSADRHGSAVDLRASLEPLFTRFGVDVVFSGHDHTYERIHPQRGISYFVSGAGGQLRRGDLRRTPLTAAGFDQDQSFMLVEIDGDLLSFAAISRRGRVVDEGELRRTAD